MSDALIQRCVREKESIVKGKLRHFFLCDDCTKLWTDGPFSGAKPVEYGPAVAVPAK